MKVGIYPGTFDPITLGHIQIVKAALPFVDKLVIAPVMTNTEKKKSLFSIEERKEAIVETLKFANVSGNIHIQEFSGLLYQFALAQNADIIFRGLRDMTDFAYEMTLWELINKFAPNIQMFFIPTEPKFRLVSSSTIKTLVENGERNIDEFVSTYVRDKLFASFK